MGTAQNQYITGAPPGSPFHLLYHAKFKDNPASEVRSQEEALEKLKASPNAAVYLTVAPEFFTQKGLDSYSLKIPEVRKKTRPISYHYRFPIFRIVTKDVQDLCGLRRAEGERGCLCA